VSDASGSIVTTEITERPLKREHLNDNDSYILELYDTVYVWQGKGASLKEKQMGMKIAKDFIANKGKPKTTKISRIPQGVEDPMFKSFFNGFYQPLIEDFGDSAAKQTTSKQEISKLAQQQLKAAQLLFDKLGKDFTKTVYWL
jgi:hypothetical protein